MPNNSIADLSFIRIMPPPILPMKQWEIESRAGVDGVTLQDTGSRGEPWQCTTIVDCVDLGEAASLFNEYKALVDGDEAVQVTYAGLESPVLYKPIKVTCIRMKKTAGGVGGVNETSNAILECVWILQPIGPIPEEA